MLNVSKKKLLIGALLGIVAISLSWYATLDRRTYEGRTVREWRSIFRNEVDESKRLEAAIAVSILEPDDMEVWPYYSTYLPYEMLEIAKRFKLMYPEIGDRPNRFQTDPWGNDYLYSGVLIEGDLCICLTSMGADQRLGTFDDVAVSVKEDFSRDWLYDPTR